MVGDAGGVAVRVVVVGEVEGIGTYAMYSDTGAWCFGVGQAHRPSPSPGSRYIHGLEAKLTSGESYIYIIKPLSTLMGKG